MVSVPLSDPKDLPESEAPAELSGTERAIAKLSRPCRSAYDLACDEARRGGASHVGAAHLLVGLAAREETAAGRLFASLSITTEEIRTRLSFVEGFASRQEASADELPLSPRAERVLLAADKDGGKRTLHEIGTLHLLNALLAERDGIAVFVLEEPGVGLERFGATLQKALREKWEE